MNLRHRVVRIYDAAVTTELLHGAGLDSPPIAPQVDGEFMSAFVRGRKPLAA